MSVSTRVGAVVIGRNEGDRLKNCLRSLTDQVERIVYVDSGSTDNSVAFTRSVGAAVVELDTSIPFTAARARNEGVKHLLESHPDAEFIQFIDGDCELDPAWLETALRAMDDNERLAVTCGRRRERFPDASRYNLLCDLEWNTPIGPARACGGDALIRVTAFDAVSGYQESLIAGEEPEMCFRMRQQEWRIERLDAEMTLHDAAMTRFDQWWKRAKRSGYAYKEGYALHGRTAERYCAKEVRSIVVWGIVLPIFMLGGAWWTYGGSILVGIALYGVLWWRVRSAFRSRSSEESHARVYATFCVLAKFAEFSGIVLSTWNRVRGRQGKIIEYKTAAAERTPNQNGRRIIPRFRTGTAMTDRAAILYISAALPSRSETFVYREIFGLRDRGWTIETASVHPSERNLDEPRLDSLADSTLQIYGRGGDEILQSALRECVRFPARSIRTALAAIGCAMRPGDCPMSKRLKILLQAIAAVAIADDVRGLKVRHIHAHMAHVPATIAMFLAYQLELSFSFTGHANDIFRERTLLATKLTRAAFSACISEWHRGFYQDITPVAESRLPIIRCGVDVDDFTPSERTSDAREVSIVAVGRLVPKKGFDILIEALRSIDSNDVGFRCTIVGNGPEEEKLRDMLRGHPNAERIEFVGAKSNAEVRELLGTADVFALPCCVDPGGDKDGIPVVLMEAMACGVPVISGDIPTIRELVRHEHTGLMVEPGSAKNLTDALSQMLSDAALRVQLGAAGRVRVIEEFSSQVNLQRLELAFDAALGVDGSSVEYNQQREGAPEDAPREAKVA